MCIFVRDITKIHRQVFSIYRLNNYPPVEEIRDSEPGADPGFHVKGGVRYRWKKSASAIAHRHIRGGGGGGGGWILILNVLTSPLDSHFACHRPRGIWTCTSIYHNFSTKSKPDCVKRVANSGRNCCP